MANTSSARKRARQSLKRRKRNAAKRSALHTAVRKVNNALSAKDKDAAAKAYKEAAPLLDRMVNRGIIHRNKAARHKSRLNVHVRALSG